MRWVALALLVGCSGSEKPPPPAEPAGPAAVVTTLSVRDETPAGTRPVQLPQEALERAMTVALSAQGLQRGKPVDTAWRLGVRARIVYGLTTGAGLLAKPAKAEVMAVWRVEVKLREPGVPEAIHAWFEGSDTAEFGGDPEALQAALEARAMAGATQVAKSLAARTKLMGEDVPALVARLADGDPVMRRAAADRLAMLKAKQAVPALAERMKTERDRETKLRYVGALAEIGDDAASAALIEQADPSDRELLRAVVDALSVVGGPRVNDFLDMLEVHDAADIREMAAQARARVKSRR